MKKLKEKKIEVLKELKISDLKEMKLDDLKILKIEIEKTIKEKESDQLSLFFAILYTYSLTS